MSRGPRVESSDEVAFGRAHWPGLKALGRSVRSYDYARRRRVGGEEAASAGGQRQRLLAGKGTPNDEVQPAAAWEEAAEEWRRWQAEVRENKSLGR